MKKVVLLSVLCVSSEVPQARGKRAVKSCSLAYLHSKAGILEPFIFYFDLTFITWPG